MRFLLLSLLSLLAAAAPLSAQNYILYKLPVYNGPPKKAGNFIASLMDEAKTKSGGNSYPKMIGVGDGYPINATGTCYVEVNDPGTPGRFPGATPGSFSRTYRQGAGTNTNNAGCAIAFFNFRQKLDSGGSPVTPVRWLADISRWGGPISFAASGGNSTNAATLAIGYAMARRTAAPLVGIDVTDMELYIYSDVNVDPATGVNGNSTGIITASYFTPAPWVTGSLKLTKVVQLTEKTIGVSATNLSWLNAAMGNVISIQASNTQPTYTVGQDLGTSLPAFGQQLGTAEDTRYEWKATFTGQPTYFCLFAPDYNGHWIFCDYETLTPYGTYLTRFDITTPDTLRTTGVWRCTRSGMGFHVVVDMSGVRDILTPTGKSTTYGHEAADHAIEVRLNNFLGEVPEIKEPWYYFNKRTPASFLSGGTAGTSNHDLNAFIRDENKVESFFDYEATTWALPFNDGETNATPMLTPANVDFAPWSFPVKIPRQGSQTLFDMSDPLQLAAPITLTVFPQSDWEVTGLVTGKTKTPVVVDSKLKTTTLPQGLTIAIPATTKARPMNPLTVTIQNPYPLSRYIVLMTNPKGVVVKLAENDQRAVNAVLHSLDIVIDKPTRGTRGGNGIYTLRILAQTCIDTGVLNGTGVPADGYVEPVDAVYPGYGWVSIGNVTFTYDGTIEVHGMVIMTNW